MERFSYKTKAEPTGQTDYGVLSANMGDGYVQRAANGINARMDSWDLAARGIWSEQPTTCGGLGQDVKGIVEFLDRHQGFKAFQWTAPDGTDAHWTCASVTKVKDTRKIMSLSFKFVRTYVV